MTRPQRKTSAEPKGPKSGPPEIRRLSSRRIVRGALSLHGPDALRREIQKFCAIPDATDLEDAQRALPAQQEVLGRD